MRRLPPKKKKPKPQAKKTKVPKKKTPPRNRAPSIKRGQVDKEGNLYFGLDDLKLLPGFTEGKRQIPKIDVEVAGKTTLTIYGSHMDKNEDLLLTHLVHNPSGSRPVFLLEVGRSLPPLLWFIHGCPMGWKVIRDSRNSLKGEPMKTVFQGLKDDPDLHGLLQAVQEIKSHDVDYLESTSFPSGTKIQRRVGEKLLDFLVPVIRASEIQRLHLIEKCINYVDSRTRTKMDRFSDALRAACVELGRLPTPPELFNKILDEGHRLKESNFYPDLVEVGLDWLVRKNSKKTL